MVTIKSEIELWRVGELASATGLTVRTLHHYDKLGLLVPATRTGAGHRLYGEQDVRRLYRIVALRQLGLRLDEIASVLDHGDPGLAETVRRHLARVELDLDRQQRLRDRLVGILATLERSQEPSVDEFINAVEAMTVIDLDWLDRDIDEWEQRIRGALVDFEVRLRFERRLGADVAWESEQQAIGTAEAFGELGLLSVAEAGAWRTRVVAELRSADQAQAPPPAREETRGRADEHLAGLLSAVPGVDAGEPADRHRARLVFMRALEALETAGAVSADGVGEWQERFAERLGKESPRERRERAVQRNCSAVELLRVLPGPPEAQIGLSVTTAEMYADGVVLRWHLPVQLSKQQRELPQRDGRFAAAEARRESIPDFRLSDDVGTSYEPLAQVWPMGIGLEHADDHDQVINWQSSFSPAVPPDATQLELVDGARRRFVLALGKGEAADG